MTEETYLETPYVFIDTQAARQENLDWKSKHFVRLRELAKDKQVTVLINSITKREIQAQIVEMFEAAKAALVKNHTILGQLGYDEIIAAVETPDSIQKLNAAFENFLVATRAIEIPISITSEELFDAYFESQPPFSAKKKNEFPDAAVVASLQAWCAKRRVKAYVVSADVDMKAACATSDRLISVDSIGKIISRASASEEFLDALFITLESSEVLGERLAEKLENIEIESPRHIEKEGVIDLKTEIRRIDSVNIYSVEITDRSSKEIRCEVGFEADITVLLEVEFEGEYAYNWDEYKPSYSVNRSRTLTRYFSAEVIISGFDPINAKEMEIESVYVYANEIEIRPEDIPSIRDIW